MIDHFCEWAAPRPWATTFILCAVIIAAMAGVGSLETEALMVGVGL